MKKRMHMSRGVVRLCCSGRWFWTAVCGCSCVLLWSLLSYLGLNSRNLGDLLINQEISEVATLSNGGSSHGSTVLIRKAGLRFMRQTNVTLIGVAKNVGPKLPAVLRQIDRLADFFSFSRAIFVQGDSTDGTDATLKAWAERSSSNRTILTTSSVDEKETVGHFAGKPMPREGRISKARNVALDAVAALSTPTEYLIVIDMDIIGWDPLGVIDSFARPEWDVMCAHGILLHGIYRDTYAFRYDGINTNHHWAGKDHAEYNISSADYSLFRSRLKVSQKRSREIMDATNHQKGGSWWPAVLGGSGSEMKPLQVKSCFGGLAIYKFDKMKSCRYSFRHAEPPYMLDCEHVLFHECIARNGQGKIFSNFNMKLWYGHSQLSSLSFKKVLSSISMT